MMIFPDYASFHLYYKIKVESLIDYQIHGAQWFELDNLPVEEMLPIDLELLHKLEFFRE